MRAYEDTSANWRCSVCRRCRCDVSGKAWRILLRGSLRRSRISLLVWMACSAIGCGREPSGRRISHELVPFFVTASSGQDTTLLFPYRVYLWGPRLAVLDAQGMRVVAFDTTGKWLWTHGRPGEGPGEYRAPSAATVAPNGNLWVLDPENARLTELGSDGAVMSELSTAQLPFLGADVAAVGDQIVFVAPRGKNNLIRTRGLQFERARIESLPSEDSVPDRAHIVMSLAADPGKRMWTAAHMYGPGFVVAVGNRISWHRYIDRCEFRKF